MRTETKQVKIYSFADVLADENLKQKVLERQYDINVDHDWWDSIYYDAEQIGCKISGFDIGRESYCDLSFYLSAHEIAQNIINNHGEQCDTYKTAASFLEEWQPIYNTYLDESSEHYESSEYEDKLLDIEQEFCRALSEDYLYTLRREYEYLTSEEAILETLEANEYEFTDDGRDY